MNTSSPIPEEIAVSIIVPVYNSGANMLKCVNSLAAHPLTNIKFVCINAGSSNGLPAESDAWSFLGNRFKLLHYNEYIQAYQLS